MERVRKRKKIEGARKIVFTVVSSVVPYVLIVGANGGCSALNSHLNYTTYTIVRPNMNNNNIVFMY